MASAPRTGSAMSSKQMAYAAVNGRRLVFTFVAPNLQPLQGYLVGMDDFHWLVAEVAAQDESPVGVTLVHKAAAATVRIIKSPALDSEPPATRAAVNELGRDFFVWCGQHYLNGKTPNPHTATGRTAS